MPTPEKHALLSASASSRWLNCTAAPRFEEQFPETTSQYAEEGRIAHAMCELKVLKTFTAGIKPRSYTARINKIKEMPGYSSEMDRTSDLYIEHLSQLALSYKAKPNISPEVQVDLTGYIPGGFGTCDCIMIGGDTGKLLQFCSGAIYDNDHKVVKLHDCKIDAYMEYIERLNGEPCITFYGFQHDKERILQALAKTKLNVRVYNGPDDEDLWNAGKIDVLLVHPSSCAYGLNLQAGGRHIVWFTPNWSFELNDQGKCRLWRQGSPYDKVYVAYLVVQGCVDEDVMAAIKDRTDTHETVMRVLKARIQKLKGEI